MNKIINLFLLILIFSYFFIIFEYYSSNKNIKNISLNRVHTEEILKTKTKNLPILKDDTNDVIEFNDSFPDEIKDNKKRSFWNLLELK